MANAIEWLLDLFLISGPKKKTVKKKSSVRKKKLAKIKTPAYLTGKGKKKNVIKNYVGRKPRSKK